MGEAVKERVAVLAYLAAVVVITSWHDLHFLLGGLAVSAVLAGRNALPIGRRSLLAVLAFNAVVTLAYLVVSQLHGSFSLHYVALINLRVLLLTFLTFLLVARVNLFRALAFSRTLLYLVTLAYSQALTLRRVADDFRMALRSRTLGHLARRDVYRHRAALGQFLLSKSLHDAREIAQAMKSRGFFID
jgi:cobalt/nickel transport system permease protein